MWYLSPMRVLGRARPRFFYGWVVVGAAFVSHFINYGVLVVSFGIFFPFMAATLGWGRGLLASVTLVSRVTSAAGAPLVGRAIDRHGPRFYVMLGGAAVAGGAALISLTSQPWHMFAAYGVLIALGGLALGPLERRFHGRQVVHPQAGQGARIYHYGHVLGGRRPSPAADPADRRGRLAPRVGRARRIRAAARARRGASHAQAA